MLITELKSKETIASLVDGKKVFMINCQGCTFRADPVNRRELRAYAVDEVLRTNGKISFDDALDLQRQVYPDG